MAVNYRIDTERGIVFSAAGGRVTDAMLREHQATLRADPEFRPHFKQLLDLSDITGVAVTAECVRELADENPFGAGAQRAMVVSRPAALGLMRMFEMLTEQQANEIRIFRDPGEARTWLGLTTAGPGGEAATLAQQTFE